MRGIASFIYIGLVLIIASAITNAETQHALVETTLTVGISLGLQAPASDPYGFVQKRAHEGLEIWRDAFNAMIPSNRTTKDGKVINFRLEVFENFGRFSYVDPTHFTFMMTQMLEMSNNASLDYVLPPVGSPWGTILRNASYLTGNVPFTIGIADSREYWYRLPGSYGAPTSTLNVMRSALPYLRLNHVKTAYVIRMQETFQGEMCQGFIDAAPNDGVEVIHTETVYFNYTTFGKPTSPQDFLLWDSITDAVVSAAPEVLVICDYGEVSEHVISLLREKNWSPKAILLSYKYAEFKDQSLLEFVMVPRSYHKDAGFPAQTLFLNSNQYDSAIRNRYGHDADYNNAQATLAGFLLSGAIMKAANSSDKNSVEMALARAQFSSFMGRAHFDIDRRQMIDNLLIQRLGGNDVVIGPIVAANADMVFPMPKWSERTQNMRWGHPTEIAGLLLMLIGAAVSIFWLIFLIRYWNHKVIVTSSPLFCVLILIGSLIIFASNIVWMPNLASSASVCELRAWLLPYGFLLLFASLTFKTYRIHRLFTTKTLKIIQISNLPLLAMVLACLVLQSVFSTIMVTVGSIKSVILVPDKWRPSLNFPLCASSHVLKYIYGVDLALCGVLLICAGYFAVQVRKVPLKLYDESTIIHYATIFTALLAAAATLFQLFLSPSQRFVSYMFVSVCMFLGPTVTVCLLFQSKWRAVHGNLYSTSSGGDNNTSNSMRNHSARHGSYHVATSPKNGSIGSTTESSANEAAMLEQKRHNYSKGYSPKASRHSRRPTIASVDPADPIPQNDTSV